MSQQATYTNTIGAPLLEGYWRDPEFNPSERAFYYVRVLEIPTPRWTTYDAAFFGTQPPPEAPTFDPGQGLHLADLVHAVMRLLWRNGRTTGLWS